MDKIYYFNVKFLGSKEQFYEVLKNYRISRQYLENDPYIWIIDWETRAIKHTKDMVFLWDQKQKHKTLAFIKVQSLPGNQTLLIVFLSSRSWVKYKPYWMFLRDELKKQGWIEDVELSLEEEYELIITDLSLMRSHYVDYNIETARNILTEIPNAWEIYKQEGGRWGPGYIGKLCFLNPTTIGRYLRAFKSAGLTEIVFKEEKIPIP